MVKQAAVDTGALVTAAMAPQLPRSTAVRCLSTERKGAGPAGCRPGLGDRQQPEGAVCLRGVRVEALPGRDRVHRGDRSGTARAGGGVFVCIEVGVAVALFVAFAPSLVAGGLFVSGGGYLLCRGVQANGIHL